MARRHRKPHSQRTVQPGDGYRPADGIPCNVNQAKLLEDRIYVAGILNLYCRDLNIMVERLRTALRQNRLDDANLETIKTRLKVYEDETKPLLDHYGEDLVTPSTLSLPCSYCATRRGPGRDRAL